MSHYKCKSRVLFDQHMIEFVRRKFHEINWTEPLRKVAGDSLRSNSFMLMMSNAIFFINSFTLEQINIQYQDDVSISRPEKKEQLLQFFIDQFNEEDKEKIITLI